MSVCSLCVPEAKLSGYTACPGGASGPRHPANIGHQISKEAIMPYQRAQGRDEGEDSLHFMYRGVDESFFWIIASSHPQTPLTSVFLLMQEN